MIKGAIWLLLVTLVVGDVFILWCLNDLDTALKLIAEMIASSERKLSQGGKP